MQPKELFVVAVTHHTAPFAIRERLSLGDLGEASLARGLTALPGLAEFVVVSTCNRIEIYGVAETRDVIERVAAVFCHGHEFDRAAFSRISIELRSEAAVHHLLQVAAGFDSQLLGETEIFGQIKKAYVVAQNRGSTGPVLNRIFQKVFQVAKQIRSHPALAFGVLSIANVAVNVAADIFGHVDRARILLLGAGDIGAKSARAFSSRGASSLQIASRRSERAAAVAAELRASPLTFGECDARLHEFDIVVCSTSAPDTMLSRATVVAAMKRRQGRPMLFIDLAMPRDVDPASAEIENVFLYNLEDLARIADTNRDARAAEMARCQPLIAERTQSLWRLVEPQLRGERGAAPRIPADRREAAPSLLRVPSLAI